MEEAKKEDEITINVNKDKLLYLFKKYNVLLLLLIPLFLSIFYRVYTYDLPITRDLAEGSVQQGIQNQIRQEIIQQVPNIDQETLDTLTTQRTNEFIKENKDQVEEAIRQTRDIIKANYQDESGRTYLPDIDTYFYLRQAQNLMDNGHPGTEKVDGKVVDNYMLAPNGRAIKVELHPYVIVLIHKISTIFGNKSLIASQFVYPLIFMSFAVIFCFFIVKRFAGKIGATLSASILAIHPSILGRTAAGFADTDTYTIFFPLAITFLFIESFRAKKPKAKLILGILAGLTTGLFAFAWGGWWFFFDVILATIGIYLIFLIIKHRKKVIKEKQFRSTIKTSITYILSSAIFVVIFTNFKTLTQTVTAAIGSIFLKQAAKPSLWPNVYTTVAELNEISFKQIITHLGGPLLVTLAIIGPLMLLFTKKHFSSRFKYSLLILLWFIVGIYASTKGIRFLQIAVIPYIIGLGITAGIVYNRVLNFSEKSLKLNKIFVSIILLGILVILFQPMLTKADAQAKNEVPNFDDGWAAAMEKIKQDSPKDAIITSWWDFGHWFKAMADRRVTFDGASQNTPRAHWVGKILLTSNEDEAMAILRMLDCGGGEDAYNMILENTNDSLLAKNITDQILLQDKEEAKDTLLEYNINDPDKILEKTHCDPPNALFITSEDMVGKSGVWAHFGSWSFERAFIYNTIKSNSKQETIDILKEKLGYSEEEASNLYSQLKGIPESDGNAWIASYPGYSGTVACGKQNETIICQNGIIIENGEAKVSTNEGTVDIALYRDDKGVYRKDKGVSDFAVAYIPDKNMVVMMSPEMLESMFTELFYYGGKNLDHFELFDHQEGIGQFDIYTWKVKWNSQ